MFASLSSPTPSRLHLRSGFELKSPREGWFSGDIRRLADHPRFLAVPGDAHGSQLVHDVLKNLPTVCSEFRMFSNAAAAVRERIETIAHA